MQEGGNKKLGQTSDPLVVGAVGAGALFAALLAAIGGWIGYSALRVNHRRTLSQAIDGERRTFISPTAGMISYYVDWSVQGRPLVLIHDINTAASAYEMHPIFEHYRGRRPVYVMDLPGFGFSDRSDRVYLPRLYKEAILDFLKTQVRGGKSVDVVALSLGAEFAARAGHEQPGLIHSLALVSPTGFDADHRDRRSERARRTGVGDLFYRLLSFRLWGQALYDLLVTPRSLRFFRKQNFHGPVDRGLLDYDYATTHQPGARFAPLYFVSGKLFSRNICEEIYEKLEMPVLVIYDQDPFTHFDKLSGVLGRHSHWHSARVAPTRGLPHFEKMPETAQALDEFWHGLA